MLGCCFHCVCNDISWAIIASKFKDKSTRQCRRRLVTKIIICLTSFLFIKKKKIIICLTSLETQKFFFFTYLNTAMDLLFADGIHT